LIQQIQKRPRPRGMPRSQERFQTRSGRALLSSSLPPHMTLSPAWRTRLFALAAAVVAVGLGVQIANGSLFWPGLIGGLLLALVAMSVQSRPLLVLLLGGVAAGLIIGNR